MIVREKGAERWMVVVVEGKGASEQCTVTLHGVSQRIAVNYAKGFNRPKKKARYPHPRAIVCGCPGEAKVG